MDSPFPSVPQSLVTDGWDPVAQNDIDAFKRRLFSHLKHSRAKNPETATSNDWYQVTALAVRDMLVETWMDSVRAAAHADSKQVYYLSLEFLMGRSLESNLLAVGMWDVCLATFADMGLDFGAIKTEEPEAALGNGGLGRLAACFMDSMATLGIAGVGYGIHYHHGMFRQEIRDGQQIELPENWLTHGNPWEFERPEYTHPIRFGGWVEQGQDALGRPFFRWHPAEELMAVAVDMAVPGYGGFSANSIRLWAARASHGFDLVQFNKGEYLDAVRAEVDSESLSRVLYPNDSTQQGRILRFKQEYFFSSASLQDILRRFRREQDDDFDLMPQKVAIQLNDTHPAIAVAELMRLLLDEHHCPWADAWTICKGVFSYTNHTLLPEALETWPVAVFEALLPRHLQIIYDINAVFLAEIRQLRPGDDDLVRRMSLIDESGERRVRMSHLAVVGSHHVNGVANLHTELMKNGIFADFEQLYPGKIVNKTNGITPRRWLNQANRPLARLITHSIGDGWQTNLDRLRALLPLADDSGFRDEFLSIKQANKRRLALFASRSLGAVIHPDSLFDVQIKRIHEYKRQILNVLHVITRYNRLCQRQFRQNVVPRTVVFAGKAAPGYVLAKLTIRLILAVAEVVNRDPRSRDALRVLFVPNYDVSTAELIIPAAELSQQISTAGTEASGTGNMKLALNGALTIGTRDGATIEIAEEVGEENLFFFGLSADQVAATVRDGYDPWAIYRDNHELAEALEMVRNGAFSPGEPDAFKPLFDSLTSGGDRYRVLADYGDYIACQDRVDAAYLQQGDWTRKAILTVARMGKFSADATILDYAREIWDVHGTSPYALGEQRN